MKNINKLLENSVRTELMGENIFTFGVSNSTRTWDFDSARLSCVNVFPEPTPLMSGRLGIGHETDITDPLTLNISKGGRTLSFHSVRNYWTPAYMETFYRSMPEAEYSRSGTVAFKERKCITADDIFVSEITVFNDDNVPTELQINICSTLERSSEQGFRVKNRTIPRGMQRIYELFGELAVICDEGLEFKRMLAPSSSFTFRIGAVYIPDGKRDRRAACARRIGMQDPFAKNVQSYNRWFEENVPSLTTENSDIVKAYYYRWHLLKKCTFTPKKVIPEHSFVGATFYESTTGNWYGCPIGLPFPMQLLEGRWMKDPHVNESNIKNWVRGLCHGYIQFTPHAAWEHYKLHKDKSLLCECYPEFVKYTFSKTGGPDNFSLPVTAGSWPTGAEYQPSFYQYTPEPWDNRYDSKRKAEVGGEIWKLYRLDEISYTLANVKACAAMAKELGRAEEHKAFRQCAESLTATLTEKFFSPERGVFLDKDKRSGKLCDRSVCYDSFAPLMWGMVGDRYFSSAERLLGEDVLGSEFSITTAEKGNPMFWFDNAVVNSVTCTKESPEFYGCCWNGPVWPYANTVALIGLGACAAKRTDYAGLWLRLFENYTELHFYLGDRALPNIVEHYRHTDGVPFSVTHDYFHSCYIDLLISYWAGIKVDERGRIIFKPLTKEPFVLRGIEINGRSYEFSQTLKGKKLTRSVREI